MADDHYSDETTPRGGSRTQVVPSNDTFRIDPTPSVESVEGVWVHKYEHGLTLGESLGAGGQAEVLGGLQRSLQRSVAVKRPLAGEEGAAALMREAYITGALEHPNIVPLHDLVMDEAGVPQLVLKRIEGKSWHDVVVDPASWNELQYKDPIEWHVRVALQLTRALSFAHQRGVLHRDIKPANVMVGEFGEVYLLDWGLAASFHQDEFFLPRLRHEEIAGTPAYMAPEQVEGNTAALGPHTDVYLLAASLWHALTGKAPWRVEGGVRRVREEAGQEIPPELTSVLENALVEDPLSRTPTAEAFRRKLEDYLRQRSSYHLVDRARRRARVADKAWAAGDHESAEFSSAEAAVLYRAARYEWDGNPAALEGEKMLLRKRISRALEQGQPSVAEKLLASVSPAPEDLVLLVEQRLAEAASEASNLSALRHEADKNVHINFRRNVVLGGGSYWLVLWAAGAVLKDVGVVLFGLVATLFFAGLGAFATRRRWMSTHHNRAVVGVWLAGLSILCIHGAVALRQDAGYAEFSAWLLVLFALGSSFAALTIEPHAKVFAVSWVVLCLVSLALPATAGWGVFVGNVVMVIVGVWANLKNRQSGRQAT